METRINTFFRLTIAYVGTRYYGWQVQARPDEAQETTVQGEMENALRRMLQSDDFTLHASGRTDRGVHALAQVAHLRCSTNMGAEQLQKGLNSLLPIDIRVTGCSAADADFHAQLDVEKKTYRYFLLLEKSAEQPAFSPFLRPYAWYVTFPLDLPTMRKSLATLQGEHDFASFQNTGTPVNSTVRTIFTADLIEHERAPSLPWDPPANLQLVEIRLTGSGFLKQMVRAIVGTLVEIGRGRLPPDAMTEILAKKDRTSAGATAPANGLFLDSVEY